MNRDEAFISQLEDYLEDFDGVTPLPDRVRVAVSAELPRTPQVRPAGIPRRMLNMTSQISMPARWGLAAAAVVVAVVAGAALINNAAQAPAVGSAPSTPSPTATTTPSPSATATPTDTRPPEVSSARTESCGSPSTASCLIPGTYALSAAHGYPARITFDVPAGWWYLNRSSDSDAILVDDPEFPRASGWGIMFSTVGSVSLDPCRPDQGSLDTGSTASVDALVATMQAWPGFQASNPEDIVIDGFPGALIELTTDLDLSNCRNPVLWTTPQGHIQNGNPLVNEAATGPRPAQLRLLDIDGSIVIIMTTDFPETSPFEIGAGASPDPTLHAPDQAELKAIVDSIRLTPETDT